jgi:hypothetical protein
MIDTNGSLINAWPCGLTFEQRVNGRAALIRPLLPAGKSR